jgi:SAM-dependent methyltransferase
MNYALAYTLGFHPWEDAENDPEFVRKAHELFDREESGREPPYGPALDLGTGSGIWGIQLAKRGWQVTGVDNVEKALARARERVRKEGVDMRLVRGDVTDLRAAGVGAGHHLILDTGTFHGLTREQRRAMAREIDAVAAVDATVYLLVWRPQRRGPLPSGASRVEIEGDFTGWKITDVEPSYFKAPTPIELMLKPDEHWYRLRRV